eukprot:GHVP01025177.1.p1 GENE.GHVP01025177.1~~GHVP01025177.1.p1  ORF type:complete len:241 (+),score=23.46 GHVP01025177.1:207-929(+)
MEAKILFDQLNSACEDYGIPEGNGFTFQDDLHQGDSGEPEFRGLLTKNGSHFSSQCPTTLTFRHNIIGRMFFIYDKIKEVFENPSDYSVTTSSIILGKASVRSDKRRETILGFEDPKDRDGRRFWTIRLCNCLKFCEAETLFERRCAGEECHKFEITWRNEEKAFDLWYAFEVVPQALKYNEFYGGGVLAGIDTFPKCLDLAYLKRKFDKLLKQIKATASDNSDTSDVRVCDKKRAEQPL